MAQDGAIVGASACEPIVYFIGVIDILTVSGSNLYDQLSKLPRLISQFEYLL